MKQSMASPHGRVISLGVPSVSPFVQVLETSTQADEDDGEEEEEEESS